MKSLIKLGVTAGLMAVLGQSASAQLLITQYYEGTSVNKWIELSNVGGSSLDLSTYSLALWSNSNTENYKTDGTPTASMALSGILAAGSSLLIQNSGATLPAYALGTGISNNTVINFNGDDSVTLYTGGTFATANIVDAIGFTDLGAEGTDKSFVRLSDGVGWNTTGGSIVTDFGSVWASAVLADVDNATVGTDVRLGYSSVTAVPEPSSIAIAMVGVAALMAGTRRKRN